MALPWKLGRPAGFIRWQFIPLPPGSSGSILSFVGGTHRTKTMKTRSILALLCLTIVSLPASAEEKPKAKAAKAKPYPLDKCLVSDEKFEGSGMEAHEFVHEGQTIKLCCKSCLKDFKKDTAAYLKKLPKAK